MEVVIHRGLKGMKRAAGGYSLPTQECQAGTEQVEEHEKRRQRPTSAVERTDAA